MILMNSGIRNGRLRLMFSYERSIVKYIHGKGGRNEMSGWGRRNGIEKEKVSHRAGRMEEVKWIRVCVMVVGVCRLFSC